MNTAIWSILLVDDNPGDQRLIEIYLRELSDNVTFRAVETLEQARQMLAESLPDLVLVDLSLPDADGIAAVQSIVEMAPRVPVVVLTGFDDEITGLASLKAGAQDYLVKDRVDPRTLRLTIRYACERHRMLQELDAAHREQLKLKDQFMSILSHELRSPMTAIYQFGTLLRDEIAGTMNAEQKEYISVILRNSEQLKRMIEDMLDAARLRDGKIAIKPECTSAIDILLEPLSGLKAIAESRGIKLECQEIQFAPPVNADMTRIRQVMNNLIENAIKFTPRGGVVTISASGDRSPQSDATQAGFVSFSVVDTGSGISEAAIPNIFELFWQQTEHADVGRNGLGVGLHVCRELVNRHGGQIEVASHAGHWSRFTFSLPVFPLCDALRMNFDEAKQDDVEETYAPWVIRRVTIHLSPEQKWSLEDRAALRSSMAQAMLPRQEWLAPAMSWLKDREEFIIYGLRSLADAGLERRVRTELMLGKVFQGTASQISFQRHDCCSLPTEWTQAGEERVIS